MMVKDYRGKSGERAIWKFDAPLVSQINDVLKQVAIEEGQWAQSGVATKRREPVWP